MMAAALCVAPSRMEHEMDEEEEEVAVALGKTTEKGGERESSLTWDGRGGGADK